jgi:hypothetical protein
MSKKPKVSKNKAKDVETKPVKLKLSVNDRMFFKLLLPQQANILEQILARDIMDRVQLAQSELDKIEFKKNPEGKGFIWKGANLKDKTVEFTDAEIEFLRTQVTRLDNSKQVTSDFLELCLKIKE